MTDENDSGNCKYDTLSVQYFNKKYRQLDEAERIELIDLWNERNK
jgi:hypothetical protein